MFCAFFSLRYISRMERSIQGRLCIKLFCPFSITWAWTVDNWSCWSMLEWSKCATPWTTAWKNCPKVVLLGKDHKCNQFLCKTKNACGNLDCWVKTVLSSYSTQFCTSSVCILPWGHVMNTRTCTLVLIPSLRSKSMTKEGIISSTLSNILRITKVVWRIYTINQK